MTNITGHSVQPVDLILISPFGVENDIFPWGVHSLKEYTGLMCQSVHTVILDFRTHGFFKQKNSQYSELLQQIFFSLSAQQKDTFFGEISNPYIFLSFLAFSGDAIKPFLRRKGIVSPRVFNHLRQLQADMEDYIKKEISAIITGSKARRIWGLSVYDRTLFACLHLAKRIKELDPDSTVLMGGDYFNFDRAIETQKVISFIDGIVVGYGEEVLRNIISNQQQPEPEPVKDLLIQGLINHTYLKTEDKEKPNQQICIPSFYEELRTEPKIAYVQEHVSGEIRILSQRGCKWGKCSFCTQIDKHLHFEISESYLLNGIYHYIEKKKEQPVIKISFDSDENDPWMFMKFLNQIESAKEIDNRFEIVLWLQVKMFEKELGRVLSRIDNKKIQVLFKLNFESLNTKTLRDMKKGHSPLQAIEAAKAVQDSGHQFITNYFIHFPLENSEGIAAETRFLSRIIHLLTPPMGRIVFTPYGANDRDSIYKNNAHYKIKTKPLSNDTWLEKAFGLKLPFSFWAYNYDHVLSLRTERWGINSYYHYLKSSSNIDRHRRLALKTWNPSKLPLREKHARLGRMVKKMIWGSMFKLFQLSVHGKIFQQRTRLIDHLKENMSLDPHSLSLPDAPLSSFYIENNILKKDYRVPGYEDKWEKQLKENELEILRYLYWTRSKKHVTEAFKNKWSEEEINTIVDDHIKRGSIVQFKQLLLCVANDRGYWKSKPGTFSTQEKK